MVYRARRKDKTNRSERGASSIEFALILPVLIMILIGVFEFGMAYNNYLAITHAAREGARLAAVNKYDEAVVRSDAYPVDPDSVSVSYPGGEVHGAQAVVTVRYTNQIDIPFFGSVSVPLESHASMRIEY